MSDNRINQHYVWRYHLSAWANNGEFYCYRHSQKSFFRTQPSSVAAERYFYESQRLTEGDQQFLNWYIDRNPNEDLRRTNREYVKLTQMPFRIQQHLADLSLDQNAGSEVDNELRRIKKNQIEVYHSAIEAKCQPILDALRSEDATFYEDDQLAADFFYFMAMQYFRTPRSRIIVSGAQSSFLDHDPHRTADTLNQIHATNVGAGLFLERNRYRIVFLENSSVIPFITGDQPVINTLGSDVDELRLYFPLSPVLAVLLTTDVSAYLGQKQSIHSFLVETYNQSVFNISQDQVYADSEKYLRQLVQTGKSVPGL